MLPRSAMRPYQVEDAQFVIDQPRALLGLKMGLGKTLTVLTAIRDLRNALKIKGALIVAPRRVAETVWKQEAAKWEHTADLRMCILRGDTDSRLTRELTLNYDAWVINYEKLPWLFSKLNKVFLSRKLYPPFDMIVFDEITSIKNINGTRIGTWYRRNRAGYKMLDYFPRRVGMTGTPAPKGYWDLLGQYYALDDGKRLGDSEKVFGEQYFIIDPYARRRVPAKGAKEKIQARVKDITVIRHDRDYLDLPDEIHNELVVDLPPKIRSLYDRLEQDFLIQLEESQGHGTINAANTGVLAMKCMQIANGNVIDSEDSKIVHNLHDEKLDALREVLEEAAGSGVMVNYMFRADMFRIREKLGKAYKIAYLGPGVKDRESAQILEDCNRGKYDMLLVNPQAASMGLNIQQFGYTTVWYGLTYRTQDWLQSNARLVRSGQTSDKVYIHSILARDTADYLAKRIVTSNITDQRGFEQAIIKYRQEINARLKAA